MRPIARPALTLGPIREGRSRRCVACRGKITPLPWFAAVTDSRGDLVCTGCAESACPGLGHVAAGLEHLATGAAALALTPEQAEAMLRVFVDQVALLTGDPASVVDAFFAHAFPTDPVEV